MPPTSYNRTYFRVALEQIKRLMNEDSKLRRHSANMPRSHVQQIFFHFRKDKRLIQFLNSNLEHVTLQQQFQHFNFYLMAYLTEDILLQAKAIKLIKDRIGMQDPAFELYLKNQRLELKDRKKRVEHFFKKMSSVFAQTGSGNRWYAQQAGKMMAAVEPNIELLQSQIEVEYMQLHAPDRIHFVESYTLEAMGVAYLASERRMREEKTLQRILRKIRTMNSSVKSYGMYFGKSETRLLLRLLKQPTQRPEIVQLMYESLEILLDPSNLFSNLKFLWKLRNLPSSLFRERVDQVLQSAVIFGEQGYVKAMLPRGDLDMEMQMEYDREREDYYMSGEYSSVESRIQKESSRNRDSTTQLGRLNHLLDTLVRQLGMSSGALAKEAVDILLSLNIQEPQFEERLKNFLYGFSSDYERVARAYLKKKMGEKAYNEYALQIDKELLSIWFKKPERPGYEHTGAHAFSTLRILQIVKESLKESRSDILKMVMKALGDPDVAYTHRVAMIVAIVHFSPSREDIRQAEIVAKRMVHQQEVHDRHPQEKFVSIMLQFSDQYFLDGKHPDLASGRLVNFLRFLELDYSIVRYALEQDYRISNSKFWASVVLTYIRRTQGREYSDRLLEELTITENRHSVINRFRNAQQEIESLRTDSLPSGSGLHRLRNLGTLALTNHHLKQVRDFSIASLKDSFRRSELGWIPLVLMTIEDPAVKDQLREEMRKHVDEPWKFAQLFSSINYFSKKVGEKSETRLRDFLLTVPWDEDVIEPELRKRVGLKDDSPYGRLAKDLANKLFSESAVTEWEEGFDQKQHAYLYINGGYSNMSNLSVNETDILSFHHGLFFGKSRILSGGGPEGAVVRIKNNGAYDRDAEGRVIWSQAADLGVPYEAATRDNLFKLLDEAATEKPKELSMVFGGHGAVDAYTLWDGGYLSAVDLLDIYQKFPAETVIRTVHLQCYAGSLLAFVDRRVPKVMGRFKKYMDYYYPANRCGLATSAEFELGKFFDWGKDWKDGHWTGYFKDDPSISLDRLQKVLWEESIMKASPVITSDYFIDDLTHTLCGERKWLRDGTHQWGEDFEQWPAKQRRKLKRSWITQESELEELSHKLCSRYGDDRSFELMRKEYLEVEHKENLLRSLDREIGKEIVKERFPEAYAEYEAEMKALEKELEGYRFGLGDENKKTLDRKTYSRVEHLERGDHLEYGRLVEMIPRREENIPLINQKTLEFLDRHPEFSSHVVPAWRKENFKRSILVELRRTMSRQREWTQHRLRVEGRTRTYFRRFWVEKILELPGWENVAERYKSLRYCEVTSLN